MCCLVIPPSPHGGRGPCATRDMPVGGGGEEVEAGEAGEEEEVEIIRQDTVP